MSNTAIKARLVDSVVTKVYPVAERINEAHRMARAAGADAVGHAIRCGELLTEQKTRLKHGEFKPWVAAHCKFSYPTAVVIMRVAAQKDSAQSFSSVRAFLADERATKTVNAAQPAKAPKVNAKPNATAEPKPAPSAKMVGYSVAFEAEFEDGPLPGFSRKNLVQNEGHCKELKKRYGKPIPQYMAVGDPVAAELASIARAIYVEREPVAARAAAADALASVQKQVHESDRERFNRQLEAAKLAQFAELRGQFHEAVYARCMERFPDLEAREAEVKLKEEALSKQLTDISVHMSHAEFRVVLNCLHPDRPDRDPKKLAQAFSIFKRLETTVHWTLGIDVLRKRGWAAPKSPFHKS